ncbi:hypothetical protein I5G60_gp22 [Mycobacterium phage Saguaro]|uniref:DUF6884 domain-containing protein n=1 Tax=Mycobacterium phage Saguaro TaxID=2315616 RepID=A0A386KAD8_9CAUD|nr:hypothetical protein I5G60_gp22 [Mycobacterium phage Saguaro]AYD82017.1 hypothetical protein SEA_SAGUARO_22 [Mycobacterium phage Saguaro]
MTGTYAHTLVVIPCAAAKLDIAAPAAKLYDSPNFRHMLAAAQAQAIDTERVTGHSAKVMILSAEHGLVELDQVLAPYDTKMGDAGQVTVTELVDQLVALAPQVIEAMLPTAYRRQLAKAVEFIREEGEDADPWIDLMDVYEAAPGIGYQRGVASSLARTAGLLEPVAA